jgi:hypothetical protein
MEIGGTILQRVEKNIYPTQRAPLICAHLRISETLVTYNIAKQKKILQRIIYK